mmetsp:Transcript_20113/g.33645  ORF Transcript_20113/g.33645 Transcript_20113/m.33645 type:complete len:344 (+) Transcript_20113:51-1082(+)
MNDLAGQIIDPRYVEAMGGVDPPPPPELNDLTEMYSYLEGMEKLFMDTAPLFYQGMDAVENISSELVKIPGLDANEVDLYITKPVIHTSTVGIPCVIFLHGGGMAINTSSHEMYTRVREDMASKLGFVSIGVEFRNSAGVLGPHPFPAGLRDCQAALQWAHSQRAARGFSKIVVAGDSGGGNLTLALTLQMKQYNLLDHIDGVYAMCPYISGMYDPTEDPEEFAKLESLTRLDRIFLAVKDLYYFARIYDPSRLHSRNPLAWPYWAQTADLTGLPPHVISLNDGDPLLDEGLAYYRKLMHAGVRVRCRTVNGTAHAGDLIGLKHTPEIYLSTLYDLKFFVDGL